MNCSELTKRYIKRKFKTVLKTTDGEGIAFAPKLHRKSRTIEFPVIFEAYLILYELNDMDSFVQLVIAHNLLISGFYEEADSLIFDLYGNILKYLANGTKVSALEIVMMSRFCAVHEVGHLAVRITPYSQELQNLQILQDFFECLNISSFEDEKSIADELYTRYCPQYKWSMDLLFSKINDGISIQNIKKSILREEFMADHLATYVTCKDLFNFENELSDSLKAFSICQKSIFLASMLNGLYKYTRNPFLYNDYKITLQDIFTFVRNCWLGYNIKSYYGEKVDSNDIIQIGKQLQEKHMQQAVTVDRVSQDKQLDKYLTLLTDEVNFSQDYDSLKCKKTINRYAGLIRNVYDCDVVLNGIHT